MRIDFELKAVAVVAILLALKLLNVNGENATHLLLARSFFGACTVAFVLTLLRATQRVEARPGVHSLKVGDRLEVRKLFKGLAIRVFIAVVLHGRFGMLQPLFISNLIGLFEFLENDMINRTVISPSSSTGTKSK